MRVNVEKTPNILISGLTFIENKQNVDSNLIKVI